MAVELTGLTALHLHREVPWQVKSDHCLLLSLFPLFVEHSVDTPGKFYLGKITKAEPGRKIPSVEARFADDGSVYCEWPGRCISLGWEAAVQRRKIPSLAACAVSGVLGRGWRAAV